MNQPLLIQIEPTADEVSKSSSVMLNYIKLCGFSEAITFQTTLCIVEALNNIVEHTQLEKIIPIEKISIGCYLMRNVLFIKITHRAPAYKVPIDQSNNLLATSGRGWVIMDSWLDQLSYQHDEGVNTLLMAKLQTEK
jgi:anti-sigma regulatory factor (Ser/Thr protein kinase)